MLFIINQQKFRNIKKSVDYKSRPCYILSVIKNQQNATKVGGGENVEKEKADLSKNIIDQRKINFVMDNYANIVRLSPYIAWGISAICILKYNSNVNINLVDSDISIDYLLMLQWGILMQYLGFREMKIF